MSAPITFDELLQAGLDLKALLDSQASESLHNPVYRGDHRISYFYMYDRSCKVLTGAIQTSKQKPEHLQPVLCKNCIHFSEPINGRPRCQSDSVPPADLVYGVFQDCRTARVESFCGPSAISFFPKLGSGSPEGAA